MIHKIKKLLVVLWSRDKAWLKALRHGVAASTEQSEFLKNIDCKTVVDIGANRGQFSLAVRHFIPNAKIISFEPLRDPAEKFESVFENDIDVELHRVAIGPETAEATIHISRRDDSSSLLPISTAQARLFPGTAETGTRSVQVARLNEYLSEADIVAPALIKLDVQGYELPALLGCEDLLHCFTLVYVECSFVELYEGQELAHEVVAWLSERDFVFAGVYNMIYADSGNAIQGDFLFRRRHHN